MLVLPLLPSYVLAIAIVWIDAWLGRGWGLRHTVGIVLIHVLVALAVYWAAILSYGSEAALRGLEGVIR